MNYQTTVDVATVWTSPDAPRDADALAVADSPDVAAWTDGMGHEVRLGLHGRTLTQLLRGEPVVVTEERGDWAHVVAPWQPSPADSRGYPGWVRRAHLASSTVTSEPERPDALIDFDTESILRSARAFLGLRYLWGGLSPAGFDCSGLVHYVHRRAGVIVPRDASAQQAACAPVPLGGERPGDLYFFTNSAGAVSHVGFVTGRLRMVHAPEGSGRIEDAPLGPDRLSTLVGVGRFSGSC